MAIILIQGLEYIKQMMHNTIARHLLTDVQLVPEQSSAPLPPWPSPPSLYTGHDVTWYGIALWPVWVSCPGCVASHLLVPPPAFLLAGHEKLKNP